MAAESPPTPEPTIMVSYFELLRFFRIFYLKIRV